MRVGLTIVLNGKHHLEHNGYAQALLDRLDLWCVVEGACGNQGSTSWCKPMPPWSHSNGRSTDGTVAYLDTLAATRPNLLVVKGQGMWPSKDHQVNAGINQIQARTQQAFLWQIDCDEQWTLADMQSAERDLIARGGKTGQFLCDYYVGPRLQAKGDWGEGCAMPYVRLWDWRGESFRSHEPPILVSGNGKQIMLPQRFRHYAYYFEQDVRFKDAWYGGHEGIYDNWKRLQLEESLGRPFPRHIRELISGPFGRTNTRIVRV